MKIEQINKIISKKSIKKPKLLVENLLPADGITILAGEPKVEKHFYYNNLLIAFLLKMPF